MEAEIFPCNNSNRAPLSPNGHCRDTPRVQILVLQQLRLHRFFLQTREARNRRARPAPNRDHL
ncbi:hypothetical protein YC2023_092860 [Brassica napus]